MLPERECGCVLQVREGGLRNRVGRGHGWSGCVQPGLGIGGRGAVEVFEVRGVGGCFYLVRNEGEKWYCFFNGKQAGYKYISACGLGTQPMCY